VERSSGQQHYTVPQASGDVGFAAGRGPGAAGAGLAGLELVVERSSGQQHYTVPQASGDVGFAAGRGAGAAGVGLAGLGVVVERSSGQQHYTVPQGVRRRRLRGGSRSGFKKSYIWAGSLQRQGAAAKKNRDVSEVIGRGPGKTASGQAVPRSRARRLKKVTLYSATMRPATSASRRVDVRAQRELVWQVWRW